jgi:biopolymer transport protein ExbD
MRVKFGIPALIALCTACAFVVACNANPVVVSDRTGDSQSEVSPVRNLIVINSRSEVMWNGHSVTLDQLKANLARTREFPVEPELQFEPDMQASYEVSAQVLNVLRDANVTKLGFVGNEKLATPGQD